MPILLVVFSICSEGVSARNRVSIDTSRKKKVERMLYGFHYEEIGWIGDGGLHAELVRNRNFEEANPPRDLCYMNGQYQGIYEPNAGNKKVYTISPLVGWNTWPLSCSDIQIQRVNQKPLNESQPHSMMVNVLGNGNGGSKGQIVNSGYYGMNFRKDVPCRLLFYVSSVNFSGKVMFRLVDEDGAACSDTAVVEVADTNWLRKEFMLTPDRDVKTGMLSIVPSGKGRFRLDHVSLMPSDTYDGGKSVFRADIMKNLVDYKPDFLRFPGGCIVHGANEATMYHWKETVGDPVGRPGAWSKWFPNYRTDGIGYHEFYQLCEYLGADAMYVIPIGMVCSEFLFRDERGLMGLLQPKTDINYYIQDALDAIEYAIGPVDSKWGAIRARNGHPAPFPLKYVEIGNEDFGDDYYVKYSQVYKALKQRYPELIYIANSPIGKESDKQKYIDYFKDKSQLEVYDEHYYHDIPWAVGMFHKFDSYNRRGIRIYVAELGIAGQYPKNILAEGIFKMGLERNGDLRPIMADRPLMRNWDCVGRGDIQPLLLHNSYLSVKTFNYTTVQRNFPISSTDHYRSHSEDVWV